MFDKRLHENERNYLRELAKKQLEYANLPQMEEKKRLWKLHNGLKSERPMIVMEELSFWEDIKGVSRCQGALAQEIESQLLENIAVVESIGDDKVVPNYYKLELFLDYTGFGIEQERYFAKDSIGFHVDPVLIDLEVDLEKLQYSKFYLDEEYYREKKEFIEEVIGDILPVRIVNGVNYWEMSLTSHVVELMGTENMFCAMVDTPEEFHRLMRFITEDRKKLLRWEEENGHLFLNNANDYMGSGSYCFSDELPRDGFDGKVRSIDTWGHLNSQESVGISPDMFREFILPYMIEMSKEYGLLYYGCCEPVSDFWKDGIEKLENLRKISISAWCKEEFMAEQLAGTNIIYSRKPSPNFLGIQSAFDETAFREYIKKTVQLTRNCKTEFIFRDIYKLYGNIGKIKKAVQIVREETQI